MWYGLMLSFREDSQKKERRQLEAISKNTNLFFIGEHLNAQLALGLCRVVFEIWWVVFKTQSLNGVAHIK